MSFRLWRVAVCVVPILACACGSSSDEPRTVDSATADSLFPAAREVSMWLGESGFEETTSSVRTREELLQDDDPGWPPEGLVSTVWHFYEIPPGGEQVGVSVNIFDSEASAERAFDWTVASIHEPSGSCFVRDPRIRAVDGFRREAAVVSGQRDCDFDQPWFETIVFRAGNVLMVVGRASRRGPVPE